MRVDSHVHVYPIASWGRARTSDHPITEYGADSPAIPSAGTGDLASARSALRRAGLDAALALNLFEPSRVARDLASLPPDSGIDADASAGDYLVWLNRWLCDVLRDDDHLYPVIAADPGALPGPSLVEHVAEMAGVGAVAVKLHHGFAGYAPDDERFDPLYGLCSDLRLPVIAHSGTSVPMTAFAPVLTRWPDLQLVAAHLGGSGWRRAPAFARMHPTVVFDLAEIAWWAGAGGAPTARQLRDTIVAIGPDRVLLGSDHPWYEPATGVALVRDMELSDADASAILGGSARRVFRLTARQRGEPAIAQEGGDRGRLQ